MNTTNCHTRIRICLSTTCWFIVHLILWTTNNRQCLEHHTVLTNLSYWNLPTDISHLGIDWLPHRGKKSRTLDNKSKAEDLPQWKHLLTVDRVGLTVVSRCLTTSCSNKGPRFSWLRSTGALRQRQNFSLAPERFPAFSEAMPHACHTPLGSRPLLVDT